jgi:folate-binding protein YgfZ
MPDISAEYRNVATGAGWLDRSHRGRLRFTGRDAAAFLQGLLTNDIAATGPGQGTYALLLTPQGRVVADFRVYNRGDACMADVEPGLAADLAARLDSMIFAEDVQVADVSSDSALVTIVGARAAEAAARATGLEATVLAALPPLAQAGAAAGAGAIEVSGDLLDALRIEAARPVFGVDFTSETIPLEAGLLERAISTTKGCYVGQEVIVRVLHRGGGRIAKRLVQAAFPRDAGVAPGQELRASAAAATALGRITSAAPSPRTDRTLALGYVKRDNADPGNRVEAGTGAEWVAGEILRLAG